MAPAIDKIKVELRFSCQHLEYLNVALSCSQVTNCALIVVHLFYIALRVQEEAKLFEIVFVTDTTQHFCKTTTVANKGGTFLCKNLRDTKVVGLYS